MADFEHERLDVYRAAIELLTLADTIAAGLPRGRAYLSDQLRRASTSIAFNIAEGAGEFATADKARFDRIARRSATEAAAILDACRTLQLADASALATANRRHAHGDGRQARRIGLGLGLGLGLDS